MLPINEAKDIQADTSAVSNVIESIKEKARIDKHDVHHTNSMTQTRENLKNMIISRRSSLTRQESMFLDTLVAYGKHGELVQAHENLMDDSLFFEAKDENTTNDNFAIIESLHPELNLINSKTSSVAATTQSTQDPPGNNELSNLSGNHTRESKLIERKGCNISREIWKAHETGLQLTRSESRRSNFANSTNQKSLIDTRSASHLDLYTTRNLATRMSSSGNDSFSSFGRRLSLIEKTTKGKSATLLRRNSVNCTISKKSFTLPRPACGRRESLDSSQRILNPSLIPEMGPETRGTVTRRKSVRFYSDDLISTVGTSCFDLPSRLTAPRIRVESESSFPSLHYAHSVKSPSLGSQASKAPSLHMAHPVKSESFRSSVTDATDVVLLNLTLDETSDVSLLGRQENEEISGQMNRDPSAQHFNITMVPQYECDGEGFEVRDDSTQLQSQEKLLRQDLNYLSRPVFTRAVSQRFSGEEGIEAADWESDKRSYFSGNRDHHRTSPRSHGFDSVSVLSDPDASNSFDETMSYSRLQSRFQRTRRRSYSEDYDVDLNSFVCFDKQAVNNIFRSSSKDLSQFTDIFDDFDPWTLTEDDDDHRSIIATLSFSIIGTSANDFDAHPHVLSPPLIESLSQFLPNEKSGENLWMKYSMVRDGSSLQTLLQHARGSSHSIIAVETIDGEVFGSFTSEPWRITWKQFGKGNAFLWKMLRCRTEKCHSIIERTEMESQIEVYPFSGANDCIQICNHNKIAVGGGHSRNSFYENEIQKEMGIEDHEWGFGLQLSNDLLYGTSSPCLTFASPALSKIHKDGSAFEIINLELWTLTPCINVEEAERLELTNLFFSENTRKQF
jgi:TLD